MNILLDTHALYWWFVAPEELGTQARRDIAHPDNVICVSAVSWFELLQKQRAQKVAPQLDILRELYDDTFVVHELDTSALTAYRALPRLDWRDPFDHLLMAQAIASHAKLLTANHRILSAEVSSLVTQDARA